MYEYTESSLVEIPTIELFQSIGFRHQNCFQEKFGDYSTLGRETPNDVVLVQILRDSLIRLNPELNSETLGLAIEELVRDRSSLNPVVANQEIYKMLRDGVKVHARNELGDEVVETVKVIDFNDIDNNDFFLASQLWLSGEIYKRRADLVGFVNGLPLIFIELKASHKRLENAYQNNLRDYKTTIPQIFWYNAVIILSNGSESRIGTITSDYDHFNAWKKINSEGEEGIVSIETIIKGTCNKGKFLDIFENFILFQDGQGPRIKILAKNHQYLGVNNAIESFRGIDENRGKLGVFWHTQGSGKSFSMIFFSQKIHRKFPGNYTFVVVTDRKELDEQIYKNFLSTGAVTEQEVHAESREHLEQLLRENHRNIFTLIHKFWTEPGEEFPLLSDRSDIIVITDEAHRTQYDTLAMNMRKALPNASFIAFTGTPLIVGEERTKNTFGDYVSIYNFKQSVDDEATVPLYYENRIPEVQLENEHFTEEFEEIIEESILDEEQEKKLDREFARQYHIITRDDRLEKIAEDIVSHFVNRGYQGKAMVVSIDKPTAVKMYDKVQRCWQKEIDRLKTIVETQNLASLHEKIKYLEETDMAVVVSGEQNEPERFKKLGLDIFTHRRRMVKEDLATKFKDPEDPFRIVFVCAMWMTGFDVQPLSTIYLDKPMKNHTLMQTIARANRVFSEKPNGLIVDYVGIFRDLQKALAIYGTSSGGGIGPGDTPVRPKGELIKELERAIKETKTFCTERSVELDKISDAEGFLMIKNIDDAVDALLVDDESKRRYLSLSGNVRKLFKAILPDPVAGNYKNVCELIHVIAEKIRSLSPDVEIAGVMQKVEDLLDRSIKAKGYVIRDPRERYGSEYIDLSKINFDELKKRFIRGRKHTEAEKLRGSISSKLNKLIRLNKLRINLLEKLNRLIEDYNSGAINIETFFDNLLVLAKELNEEEKRGISENLSEEELAVFDLLYKPDLNENEKKQVKLAAKHLLELLKKEKFVLDWRKRQQSRASVLITIRDVLDRELPRSYTPEIYQQKCDFVYQHIYDSYYGMGKSVYSSLA